MFPSDDPMFPAVASPATSLDPGPSWFNVYDPEADSNPPRDLRAASAKTARLARTFFVWVDRIYIATGAAQVIATDLTRADVVMPPEPR